MLLTTELRQPTAEARSRASCAQSPPQLLQPSRIRPTNLVERSKPKPRIGLVSEELIVARHNVSAALRTPQESRYRPATVPAPIPGDANAKR
ncbi:hypothetical protein I553_10673 [Mycobacterium xenopi 4042]|uniref:Uncharacterized protein n=1 Tax=Mycobacterium xenopi 4042 TaxID=1299334 RepID=X8DXF4_MYCXE|nr:hypothetical protein I553_10673 [Mycobacterium xenopi 4042]